MSDVIKIELYKIFKTDNWKYIIVMSLIPILWAVYLYSGRAVFPESDYNMIQWITLQMFSLNEQFLMPIIFALITSQLFVKEIDEKYINLLNVRNHSLNQIYMGKIISIVIYFILTYILISLIIGLSYLIVVMKSKTILSGEIFGLWEENLKTFFYWFLNLSFNCFLVPTLIFTLGARGKSYKALGLACVYFLGDHIFSTINGLGSLTIWRYLKESKYIIESSNTDITMLKPIILVLVYGFVVIVIGKKSFITNYKTIKEDKVET